MVAINTFDNFFIVFIFKLSKLQTWASLTDMTCISSDLPNNKISSPLILFALKTTFQKQKIENITSASFYLNVQLIMHFTVM